MESPPATPDTTPSPWWSRLWASRCAGCGTWPAGPVGDALCGTCEARFAPPQARCPGCALPWDGAVCPQCQSHPLALDACCAAVDYAHPWSHWIHRFKLRNEPAWSKVFARLMCAQPALRQTLGDAALWLPIPMTGQALGERGYNQAWVLTRALAARLRPDHPALAQRLRPDLLVKLIDTATQHTLNRQERLNNLRHAFALSPGAEALVQGQRVVLVDDVMTTGATLHAAARCLKAAGATHVAAVVLARTPPPDPDD